MPVTENLCCMNNSMPQVIVRTVNKVDQPLNLNLWNVSNYSEIFQLSKGFYTCNFLVHCYTSGKQKRNTFYSSVFVSLAYTVQKAQ